VLRRVDECFLVGVFVEFSVVDECDLVVVDWDFEVFGDVVMG